MASSQQVPVRSQSTALDDHEKPTPDDSVKGEERSESESLHEKTAAARVDSESQRAAQQSQPSANHAASIPNGGLQAWLQVLGGWMLFFNTWGMLNTFGIFQTYYESVRLETSSNIAWIGAIQAFLVLFIGAITGPVYDMGFLRTLLIAGSFLVVFGMMMLSLCQTYWQVLLAQGFTVGLGAGCLFVPGVALLPTYFSTKIGLAVGLAASGSSTGGIIYPIVFYRLIDRVGFGWSVRVIGFMALATLLIPISVMKMRVKPAAKRKLIDTTAFTDFYWVFFVATVLVGFVGLYTGLFYISYYAEADSITSARMAFYLVPILNAGSVFGRTVPNYLSDIFGPLNIMTIGGIVMGVLTLILMAVSNLGGIVTVTLLYGFFSGVYIALPPVIFVRFTEDKSKIGTRMGMAFAIIAGGVFIGGPGAGALLGSNQADENWTSLWTFGGVFALVSGVMLAVMRMIRAEWKIYAKV